MSIFGLGRRDVAPQAEPRAVGTPQREEVSKVAEVVAALEKSAIAEVEARVVQQQPNVAKAVNDARCRFEIRTSNEELEKKLKQEQEQAQKLAEQTAAEAAAHKALIDSIPTDEELIKKLDEAVDGRYSRNSIEVLEIPVRFIDLANSAKNEKEREYYFPTFKPSVAKVLEALCQRLEGYGLTVTVSGYRSYSRDDSYASFIMRGYLDSNNTWIRRENTFAWHLEQKQEKSAQAKAQKAVTVSN